MTSWTRFCFLILVSVAVSGCASRCPPGACTPDGLEMPAETAVSGMVRHYAIDLVNFHGNDMPVISERLEQLDGYRSLRIAESTGSTLRIWYESRLSPPVLMRKVSRMMENMGHDVLIRTEGPGRIRVENR